MAKASQLSPAKRALLERALSGASTSSPAPARIPRRPEQASVPLSAGQEQVWFFSQLSPELGVYNEGATVRKRGPLDLEALRRAFDEVVRRHEIWRTCFPVIDGRPVQRVLPHSDHRLPLTDLTALPAEQREPEAVRLATEDARAPYDLTRGPLVRPRLVRLAQDDHRLYLALNHVVFDGVSLYRVLLPELVSLYDAYTAGRPSSLPEPELQYGDFALWERQRERGVETDRRLDHWRRQLAGELPDRLLPTDRERPPSQRFHGAVEHLEISREVVMALKGLAHREGASVFMVLAAAFTALLHRYSGSDDVVFGTPIDGRGRPEMTSMMGFCLNAVVLRADAGGDPSFTELVRRLREVTLTALANEVPFDQLVRELRPERDLSRNPLFQVMFGIEPPAPEVDPHWSIHQMDVGVGTSKFDLYLEQDERPEGHISCRFVYDSDLFEAATVERLAGHWLRLLEGVAADPGRRISELPLLEEEERVQLLEEWNRTEAELPEACTHDLISAQARRSPAAAAVECEGRSLSYRELEAAANRLGHHLRSLGVGPGVPVGLCLERSLEMVVGALAIWKAGGAYVPLDPGFPAERLAYMLEDSGAPVLLTQRRLREELGLEAASVVSLDEESGKWARLSKRAPESGVRPSDLAYVIYTSGSTGRPKGVEIEHRALVNFLTSMAGEPGLGAEDVLVAVTTLSFDIAGLELYLPLLRGGKVVVASREVAADGRRLGELLASSGATVLQATPASWRLLLESGWAGSESLTALCGGEALSGELAEQLLARCGRLYNLYGPTETTIWSTLARVEAGKPLGIGRPLQNTQVYVLDGRLEPVPVGVAGELYIGGAGLARGYHGRPELTAERFVPSPFGEGERLYRTGDAARWRPEGELEYLGRLDQQVKVRGFRIEPGEIEALLERRPEVARAVVVARELSPGDRRLVAYLVAEGEAPEPGELKAELRRRLPEYMVPSAFVFLEELPLTANAKVDRRALPAPEPEAEAGSGLGEFEGPATELEQDLAGIWGQVLGLQRVDRRADFFELGGHSLLATRLAARVREELGVELPLRSFFEARSLSAMAALVEVEAGLRPEPRVAAGQTLQLSFSQRRPWFMSQLRPDDPAQHLLVAMRLEGDLDEPALLASLQEITRRHQVLRSVFLAEDGEPVQRVLPCRPVEPRRLDLGGLAAEAREEAAARLVGEAAARPFDLAGEPPLRVVLDRLGPRQHLLGLVVHEIAADDRSLNVLLAELEALYPAFAARRPSPLPEPALQHHQHASQERKREASGEMAGQVRYWRWRLQGLQGTELPPDRPRPSLKSLKGSSIRFHLPGELAGALAPAAPPDQAAWREAALAAAFAALLSRHVGQHEVGIGRTVPNRAGGPEEAAIGPFANVLPLRVDLGGDPSFGELTARVLEMTREVAPNQELPFDVLVEELRPARDLSRSPLFQVLFSYQRALPIPRLPGLRANLLDVDSTTLPVDLALRVRESESGLDCELEYDAALFAPPTVQRLAERFRSLLEASAQAPETPLSELPVLTEQEQAEAEADWNASRRDYPREASIADLFEAQVRRRPGAVAVEQGLQRLTYRQLEARANQVAHRLRELGAGPQSLCGVCLPRSLDMVVAVLGVLKAGAAYLPLDPAYPVDRLDMMLRDAQATVLLTQERIARGLTSRLPALDVSTVLLDSGSPLITCQPEVPPARPALAEELAYVIYTSGSAGKPKGVMIEHRAVVNHLQALQRDYGLGEDDNVLQLPSLAFHPSVRDILGTLCAGARLVLVEEDRARDARAILRALEQHEITCLLSLVPSLGRALLAEPGSASLRLVLTCGETLRTEDARGLRSKFGCEVANQFGPSECVMAACKHTFGPADEHRATVLAGRPEANARLYVLDAERRLLPAGLPGELYVGGESLARGYLGQPELTAERFLPDLFSPLPGARIYRTGDMVRRLPDGNLEFLGRSDDQVKVRGFRIELGEVEATLAAHPELREVAVAVRGERLVAYCVPRRAPGPAAGKLGGFLKERLPEHMLPALYVELEALPLMQSGKLDRRALPDPGPQPAHDPVAPPPQTATEQAVARIWADALGLTRVSVHDDFFELGGDSLLAIRVVAAIEKEFGRRLPLASFFRGRITVRVLAQVLERELEGESSPLVVKARPAGSLPPLFFVFSDESALLSLRHFLAALGPDQPVYGLLPERSNRRFDRQRSVEDLGAGLLAVMRRIQPAGPYHLCGHSLGGLIAYDIARQLVEAGETMALLGVLDSLTPAATAGWIKTWMNPRARMGRHLRRGFREGVAKLWEVADREARSAVTRVTARWREMAPDEFDNDGALAVGLRYQPHGYGGPMIVFWTDSSAAAAQGQELGWSQAHGGPIDCVHMGGDHLSALQQPQVAAAAAALAERLRAVQRGDRRPPSRGEAPAAAGLIAS
ncbi:MAG: hypothetical protein DLM67_16785 [Candidatus Nephthysia bennettiae]|nr:MAG: hypothetical protein DLM67_16785 [Candidatus Dormibacteraeota bacterium]